MKMPKKPNYRPFKIGALLALTAFILYALTGCSSLKELTVRTAPVRVEYPSCPAPLPMPDPIKTLPISWTIISYGNPPAPVFALSAQDYENLSRGLADTRRWVDEAAGHLRYYQKTKQP